MIDRLTQLLYHSRTYLWFDEKGKKTRVAAPQYIDYVMTFTQRTVSDETIFPTKYGESFNIYIINYVINKRYSFVFNNIGTIIKNLSIIIRSRQLLPVNFFFSFSKRISELV